MAETNLVLELPDVWLAEACSMYFIKYMNTPHSEMFQMKNIDLNDMHKVDHSTPTSAAVKNVCDYNFIV